MPKIENWSRRQDLEGGEYSYILEHDKDKIQLRIFKTPSGTAHVIELRARDHGHWNWYRFKYYDTEEEAKEYARDLANHFTNPEYGGEYLLNIVRNGRKGFERKSIEGNPAPFHSFKEDRNFLRDLDQQK